MKLDHCDSVKHILILLFVCFYIEGVITTIVIILSRYFHINPDNIATPIAGSLGDITALALLSWIANTVYLSSK